MKKILTLLILLVFLVKQLYPQQNDTQAALYNIGFGFVFGSIGAVINKKPKQKWHKVLIKGAYQGSLGGLLIFGGKKLLSEVHNKRDYTYLWPSKLLYSAGNSIIENAASNRNFWEHWHITIGFNRIEFETKNKFRIKYKILPVALYGTILTISISSRFDFKTSLISGNLIFRTDKHTIDGYHGFTFVNTILLTNYNKNLISYYVLPHEIIHAYQYEDFGSINTFFNPLKHKFISNNKVLAKLNNWIYFDFQAFFLNGLYRIESINTDCHYDNYFEHEAGYYSKTIYCP